MLCKHLQVTISRHSPILATTKKVKSLLAKTNTGLSKELTVYIILGRQALKPLTQQNHYVNTEIWKEYQHGLQAKDKDVLIEIYFDTH